MFALELDARLREQGSPIRSLAAHPGIARTELQPTAIASVGNRFEALAYRLMDPLFQSAGSPRSTIGVITASRGCGSRVGSRKPWGSR